MVIDLLERFGREEKVFGGCRRLSFDKRSRRLAESWMGRLSKVLDPYWGCYAIVANDGAVVTIAHQH